MSSAQTNEIKGAPLRKPPAITQIFASKLVSIVLYFVIVSGIAYGSFVGAQSMGYNWQWYRVPQFLYTYTEEGFELGVIFYGLQQTLLLSLTAFILATVLGLIVALLRLSGLVVGTAVAIGFLELIRNIPLLVLLYLFYYVLGPIFGFDRYTASVLCLAVFHSALISEILRAGINAVPQGQWEGATSIGMTKAQTYRYIILPQSIKFMLPPMTGEVVHLVKSSAIVSVIAVAELTTIGRNIISDTYMSFEIWFTIAIVYMVVTLILSVGVSYLEKKYEVDN
ncbi:amino acid ABC transporter permease [Cochlodiniinecator piscidefendens]|uniref:amino acid ABC transporter permease n=1 Tax=Cochlodiniinecator piscidefendens TaxID=2715756 RepID=UPI00140CCB05|nr:amino acid ABC transporter permease [Cochlodiniinecator piscidefendens]